MPEYLAHLVRERHLSDGRAVTIRPMRKDDANLERAFLDGLSGESRYNRFMKWVATPSEQLVRFLTDVDYDRHMAFACTAAHGDSDGKELVGQARDLINPDGKSCEFSIVIADAWHRTGIAGLLMEALMRAARERGLATMQGIVLRANNDMRRFVHALGFEISVAPDDPTLLRVVKRL